MEELYDIIIIGAGPGGMAASVYAGRANLKTLLLEKGFAGGQVVNTYEVDNYPGFPDLTGIDLAMKMQEHASKYGINPTVETVEDIDLSQKIKVVKTANNEYKAKTVILGTGATWRKLGAPGEIEFGGKGVSYCATCDGAFYKDKVAAVVGGGDVAVEDAIFLSRFCTKVYLIHRRDELRAVKILQNQLLKLENVEVLWNTEVEEIYGEQQVQGIKIKNNKTNEISQIELNGVFIGIGTVPNSELFKDKVQSDESGYIICNEECQTSVSGVFAVGDVRKKLLRQIITAAADGATAVFAAEKYILENF